MKTFRLKVIIIGITFLMIPQVTMATGKKLQKDLSFDDLLVKGKYQFSNEAVVTVEQDKVLDSLLGVRKDFKDRIKRSAERH